MKNMTSKGKALAKRLIFKKRTLHFKKKSPKQSPTLRSNKHYA